MKDKKEIGFDILENSGNDIIEKIGTDDIMVTEKERKRILEMSKNKFNAAMNADAAITQDSISGVEEYSRPSITRIISAVACTAAAALLICTGILMLKHNDSTGPEKPDPLIATELTTDTTTNTSTDTSTNTNSTSAATHQTYQTHTTYTDMRTADPQFTETTIVTNPPVVLDTSTVSTEDLEAARIKALDKCVDSAMATSIDYKMCDINGDSIPELIVSIEYVSYPQTGIYVYNGEEYVPGTYYSYNSDMARIADGEGIQEISPSSHMIHLRSKEGHSYDAFLRMNEDNTFDLLFEYGYNGVWENGVKTTDVDMTNYWDLINKQKAAYTWEETVGLTNYHGETPSLIKYHEESRYQAEHWEEIQAEYRKEHPHGDDWAMVSFNCKALYDNGFLPKEYDENHIYGYLHGVATYSDGSTEEMGSDISEYHVEDPYNNPVVFGYRYGDHGDKPVHAVAYLEINNTAITLFDVDFDFPNRRILENHGNDFSSFATVEYVYNSDNY